MYTLSLRLNAESTINSVFVRNIDNLYHGSSKRVFLVNGYVLVVKDVSGPWGREYELETVYVNPGIRDGTDVWLNSQAITNPVVKSSSEPVWAGRKVRFYP